MARNSTWQSTVGGASFDVAALSGVDGGALLTLHDDLDSDTAGGALREAGQVIAAAPAAVLIDLGGFTIAAAGIRVVVTVLEAARDAAIPVAVVGGPPWLVRLAPTLGLADLPWHPDVAAAVAHLAAASGGVRAAASERLEDLDELAKQYVRDRHGLPEAQASVLREQLIGSLLPFAGRLARRYRDRREPMEDLEQVARMGLVKAVDRYDPGRGSFTAFALATISGDLKRHFRDRTWVVHVPRRLQELALAVTRAQDSLTAELGRRPTDREVARRCGIDVRDVADARRSGAGYRPASLSQPIGDSEGQLGDLLGAADPAVETVPDQVTLHRLIPHLPPRERRILLERFYGDRTQAEIAADLGISQMHVSRLLSRTLGWLREAMLNDEAPAWPTDAAAVHEADPVVTEKIDAGTVRVYVAGEVDRDNAERLRRALLRALRRAPAGSRLVIELGGVPMLDASGIAVLLSVYEVARARDVRASVSGLQPFVRHVVAAAGLLPLLAGAPR